MNNRNKRTNNYHQTINCVLFFAVLQLVALDDRVHESFDGIEKTAETVLELIAKERDSLENDENIILGGFSQGAAVSMYVGKITLSHH